MILLKQILKISGLVIGFTIIAGISGVVILDKVVLPRMTTHVASSNISITKPYIPPTINIADVYTGVNNERIAHGLGALAISHTLEVSACAKANDMVKYDYWAHVSPSGVEPWHWFDIAGYSFHNAGENLAYGLDSAEGLVIDWVISPSHEANIVGNYTEMGVCSIQAKSYQYRTNVNVIVNHFGSPK